MELLLFNGYKLSKRHNAQTLDKKPKYDIINFISKL